MADLSLNYALIFHSGYAQHLSFGIGDGWFGLSAKSPDSMKSARYLNEFELKAWKAF